MKTTIQKKLNAILVATMASGFLISWPLQAQVHTRGSAKGGASKLMRTYAAEQLKAAGAERTQAMDCENCKDLLVTVRARHFKGAGTKPSISPSETKQVLRHACSGCTTQWKVKGHGKNRVSVAKHGCSECR